jgi:hypothetical protein
MSTTQARCWSEIEAAHFLAVHPKTLARLRRRGAVPHLLVGASVRYDPDVLRAALAVPRVCAPSNSSRRVILLLEQDSVWAHRHAQGQDLEPRLAEDLSE